MRRGIPIAAANDGAMGNTRFGLVVYLGVLLGCAVIGLVVTLGGNLLDHVKIYESVVVAVICGGGLYAAVALLQRRELVAGAGLVVALELIAFVLAVHSIWAGRVGQTSGRWSTTFLTLAIAALVVTALRTMIDALDPVVRAAFLGTTLCWTIASAFVIKLVWDLPEDFASGTVKTAASFYVLGAFGFLATPALQRFRAAADGPAEAGPSTTI